MYRAELCGRRTNRFGPVHNLMKYQTTIILLFCTASFSIFVSPWLRSQIVLDLRTFESVGWPTHFMGEELLPIPLSENEEGFYRDFPGEAAQFQVGTDRLILRRVHTATRKLHPAKDCFKGMGFSIEETGLRADAYERIWRTFNATKAGESYQVFELIVDESGNTWSDVSSWYWSVVMDRSQGPWTSFVHIREMD